MPFRPSVPSFRVLFSDLSTRRIATIGGRESCDPATGAPLPPTYGTLVGAGGDYSDFQSIVDMLTADALQEQCEGDGDVQTAAETWSYLRAVLYARRNKMDPLWNDLIVAGIDPESRAPFLGVVDKIGTAYEEDMVATGFGSYIAIPIMRDRYRPDLEEGEARALLEDCMRVLFYRDCRALNRMQIAKAEVDGTCLISEPYEIETSWDAPAFRSANKDGGW